ncbi:periplasmic heavy metal sensor [Hyalangium gracile]|uniref:periplasmic heavy metal sensor n=1 Tax=Hyalangium gracile TaxID=394092 RepID=UPI001CCDC652|nr:periplasmic heavy metal sensor [Hyalangium gracile]
MKHNRVAVLMLTLLPLVALAAPPDTREEAEQEAERRMRTARIIGLAEELELDSAQALKLDETMRKFDERRRPLRQQVRESAEILERAASGDTAVQAQVDQAAQRAFDARAQLAALDREMFQALSRDLPPQKRAKLALFMARFESQFSKFKHKFREKAKERLREKLRKYEGLEDRG